MTIEELIAAIESGADEPATADDVRTFEKTLGARLPDDYRDFLLATRGGKFGSALTFPFGDDRDFLARAHGLAESGRHALVERASDDRAEGVLPEGMLRIMDGRGGDAIAIVLRADRLGEIFFVDHEVADPDEPTPSIETAESDDWGYAIPLAPSFIDFVTGLATEDD